VGFPGAYYLGELWVSYKLTLMAPKVESQSAAIETRAEYVPTAGSVPAHYERRWLDATKNPISGGFDVISPPLSDSSLMWNTAGWTTGTDSRGVQCMMVPAGSSGYYLVNLSTRTDASGAEYLSPSFEVFDNTGSWSIDETVVSHFCIEGTIDVVEPASTKLQQVETVVIHLVVPPDRPMKLGLWATDNGTMNPKFNISVIRMPDRLFAAQTGSTTVSLADKVQRIQRSRATVAASSATAAMRKEEKENSLAPPELNRSTGGEQTSVVTTHLTSPLPVRPANPPPDLGMHSVSSVRSR